MPTDRCGGKPGEPGVFTQVEGTFRDGSIEYGAVARCDGCPDCHPTDCAVCHARFKYGLPDQRFDHPYRRRDD